MIRMQTEAMFWIWCTPGLRVQVIRFFTVQKLSHFLWPPLFFSEYKYIFFSVSVQATGDKKQLLLLFFHEQRFLRLSHKFPSFYSISDYLSVKKLPSLRSEISLKKIKKEQPTSCSFFIWLELMTLFPVCICGGNIRERFKLTAVNINHPGLRHKPPGGIFFLRLIWINGISYSNQSTCSALFLTLPYIFL